MRAYVDTSVLAAVVLDERGAGSVRRKLRRCEGLYSSNLLEAELRSVVRRAGVPVGSLGTHLAWLNWVFPDRPLTEEMVRVLDAGLLRGADLWHLACALFLSPEPADIEFLTLDRDQARTARALGFRVPAL
ncbi:MAG: PIN domain-containing protein [Nitrospirae bacterium]|nr:PIN domain-containing protein [Nitrospirota bacterium]